MSTGRVVLTIVCAVSALAAANAVLQYLFVDLQRDQYLGAANLAQALSDVSSVKRLVTVHYIDYGRLAEDNAAIGLGAPASFAADAVRSLEVRHGAIIVTFGERIEEGARLVWKARPSTSGVGDALAWRCESDSLPRRLLETAAPGCEVVDSVALREPGVETAPPPTASVEELINAIHLRRRGQVLEIVAQGVNVNVAHRGLLPMQIAIEQGDRVIVEALLGAGADPNATVQRQDNMTMLMYAVSQSRRNVEIARALVTAGARLEARDARGRTALMHAAYSANAAAMDVLLKAGAQPQAVDHEGNAAANFAARHGTGSSVYRRLQRPPDRPTEIIVVIPERD